MKTYKMKLLPQYFNYIKNGTKRLELRLDDKKTMSIFSSTDALGVKPGEIVTIMLPACPEEVFLFYAIDQLGACANFIFPGTPLSEVEHTMEEFNSKKLIILEDILMQPNNLVNNPKYNIVTTSLTGEHKIQGKNIYTWDTFDKLSKYVEMPIYKRNQEEPLFIAKTGGSTGKPKAVVLADRHFNLQVQQHLNSPSNEILKQYLFSEVLFAAIYKHLPFS